MATATPCSSHAGLRSLLWAPLLAGCVTTVVDQDEAAAEAVSTYAVPVVMPIGGPAAGGDEAVLQAVYESLLVRLTEAYRHRDLPELRSLLAGYQRDTAPAWARERMDGFVALADGLAFELHCRERATLAQPVPVPPLGAEVTFALRLPPLPGATVVLGGERDAAPTSIGVWFWIADDHADGSVRQHESNATLRLPARTAIGETGLEQPLALTLAGDTVVRRRVVAEAWLLPGYVTVADRRAPVRRSLLGRAEIDQYPAGHEAIRARPLLTLREAMRLGDPDHFAHVWLGAAFAPAEDREAVLQALIDWVRLGRPDQQRVAMAALKNVTGARPVVGDREGWLAWWQARR